MLEIWENIKVVRYKVMYLFGIVPDLSQPPTTPVEVGSILKQLCVGKLY